VNQIGQVHYDLLYESNPLSLSSSLPPQFAAEYEGWGCYDRVFVTIALEATQDQRRAKDVQHVFGARSRVALRLRPS
jgi:hypothetical protein